MSFAMLIVCYLNQFAFFKSTTNVDCFIPNGCEPLKRMQGDVGLRLIHRLIVAKRYTLLNAKIAVVVTGEFGTTPCEVNKIHRNMYVDDFVLTCDNEQLMKMIIGGTF
ncbi:hypothetical protein T12_11613 [Trichinella patagoniensis]|uniref:Reverse transcriptase domain-containing protein n=1 Tax=Trichinella patagoniensis TaxID=990121 RepID=A0A0V0ZWC8_9BILA|nr:hypothetical protein T12_11613 [Trichinella patagoniensis]